MKPNQQSENSDERLHSVLREWVVDAPLPPRFQEQVWQRIGRAEAPSAPGFWVGFRRWMEGVLPRPQFTFSYIAALLILGVAGGSVAAQLRSSRMEAALGQRYIQSIDPYRAELTQP